MKKINQAFPLINEDHPSTYGGPPFLTLVRFNGKDYINIIDNVINNEIVTYVLDLCPKEFDYKPELQEQAFIEVAYEWFETSSAEYPISIEFSRRGISSEASKILRRFPVDFVTRVIGPLPRFEMGGPFKVKKRKRKPIPKDIEFVDNVRNR
jgi:hypothetical protein